MRTLKPVISRVNQLAERPRLAGAGNLAEIIAARLLAARQRCAAGPPPVKPEWWVESDDALRQRWADDRRIAERLIGAPRRMIEHGRLPWDRTT